MSNPIDRAILLMHCTQEDWSRVLDAMEAEAEGGSLRDRIRPQ